MNFMRIYLNNYRYFFILYRILYTTANGVIFKEIIKIGIGKIF